LMPTLRHAEFNHFIRMCTLFFGSCYKQYMVKSNIILRIVVLSTLIPLAYSSTCQCIQISSWQELRQQIFNLEMKYLEEKYDGVTQEHMLLCPFNITKMHTQNSNHWTEFIPIRFPVHIQCHKLALDAECLISVTGPKCSGSQNCGRHLFRIESDNVWLEGLSIKNAKDNVIFVKRNQKNAKLIEMSFYNNQVPRGQWDSALIASGTNTTTHIIMNQFSKNMATTVRNGGQMIITSSKFKNNMGASLHKNVRKNNRGAILNRGELILTGNTFLNNTADIGPAVFSSNDHVYDTGKNCATGNKYSKINGKCDGVQWVSAQCEEFLNGQC